MTRFDDISGAAERMRRAREAGIVRGMHYTEWCPTLDEYRSEGRDSEALDLLTAIFDATEAEARISGREPAPGYYKRAAIIYRRRGDIPAEIAVLQRFLDACPPGIGGGDVAERLAKAQKLLESE